MGAIERVYKDLSNVVMITIAPEIPGAIEVIRQLSNMGIIVSVGNTILVFFALIIFFIIIYYNKLKLIKIIHFKGHSAASVVVGEEVVNVAHSHFWNCYLAGMDTGVVPEHRLGTGDGAVGDMEHP